uniref:Uncharacterized protein n=1 Tax=Nelumbo nucifera TaxID=4432 RepID=A0A822ZAV9_NELNU|nr:TPA_asm: hypothetical protein HUJ06_016026 [Nelumbo nucifera]
MISQNKSIISMYCQFLEVLEGDFGILVAGDGGHCNLPTAKVW